MGHFFCCWGFFQAVATYGKYLDKKDRKREARTAGNVAPPSARAANAIAKSEVNFRVENYLNKDRMRDDSHENRGGSGSLGAGSAVAPWEEGGDGGTVGAGRGLLGRARTSFKVGEVRGLGFVGGFSFEELPSLGLPEVAFLGRSNVGKSSMLNCLAGPGQRPALVSKMPGRTQRINLFKASDRQGPFMTVRAAGAVYVTAGKGHAVSSSLAAASGARVAVVVPAWPAVACGCLGLSLSAGG